MARPGTMMLAMDNSSGVRLQFGTVTLIPDERLLLKDGHPVSLTPKAFDLLVFLVTNPGRLLTKEQLLDAVWPGTIVEESNLAYHVFAIRKAFGEDSDAGRYIETVPKSGYRFVAPVVRVVPDDVKPADQSGPPSASPAARIKTSRPWLGLGAGVALVAVTLAGFAAVHEPGPRVTPLEFQEPVTGRLAETGMFSISPDGNQFVFAAEGPDGVLRLYRRTLSKSNVEPLPGTEVFAIIPPVVWSPDSRFVAFDPGGSVRRVALEGGAVQTVCEFPSTAVGGTWNREGQLLLGNAFGSLISCDASGGPATTLTGAALPDGERHIFPSFLRDGRHFVFLRVSRTDPQTSGIYAGELGPGSSMSSNGKRLITTGFGAVYVLATDSSDGVLVFARDGGVFAQRLDERRLEMTGDPVRLADGIGSYLDGAWFSVSATTLVYRAGDPETQLTWFDRRGQEMKRVGSPARFSGLALSPDANRVVVTTQAPQGTTDRDLWLFDFSNGGNPTPLTFTPALELSPVWSSNDRFVFGSAGGASGVFEQVVGGERRLVFKSDGPEITTSVSADGRYVLYTTLGRKTGADVWVYPADTVVTAPRPLLQGPKDQSQAQLSPDSRWVAYVSNEAGPNDIFITRFPTGTTAVPTAPGKSVRISEGGGFAPRWRRDGRELFYLTPDGSVMAITVDAGEEFHVRPAKRLFKVPGVVPDWGVTADGARFLFAVPVSQPAPFNFVRDWQARLPRKQ